MSMFGRRPSPPPTSCTRGGLGILPPCVPTLQFERPVITRPLAPRGAANRPVGLGAAPTPTVRRRADGRAWILKSHQETLRQKRV